MRDVRPIFRRLQAGGRGSVSIKYQPPGVNGSGDANYRRSFTTFYGPHYPRPPFRRFAGSCSRSIPEFLLSPRFLPWLGSPSWFAIPIFISERGFPEAFLLPYPGNWSATLSSIHPGCLKASSKRSITSHGHTDGSGTNRQNLGLTGVQDLLRGAHQGLGLSSERLPASVRGTRQKASTAPRTIRRTACRKIRPRGVPTLCFRTSLPSPHRP